MCRSTLLEKIFFCSFLLLVCTFSICSQEPDPDSLLERMEEQLYPDAYYMRLTMSTRGDGRDRDMEFETYYKSGKGSYMEILSPPRSRGTRFLNKDDALWMYMPRSGSRSPVRLPARDSFQGSVFSNDDVGDSSYTDDYRAELVETGSYEHDELGSVPVYVIDLHPIRPEAAYGRIRVWMSRSEAIALRMDYYVRSGLRSKQMFLSDIRQAAGRSRPMKMEMISLDQKGKVSMVEILRMEERSDLPDRTFSRGYLSR